jgi:FtsH-binding integral membrane protein
VVRDLYYRLFPWFWVILVVPLFLAIGLTWARQPRFTRAAAGIVAPALLLTGFLFSSVIESRIFTPVIPLLMPGLLFALFPSPPRS